MSGRIVIPIRNLRGQLVAYAGRALDGAPNYKLPAGFRKGLEVFNFERAAVTVPRIPPLASSPARASATS
jgi:DNA primase